MVSIICGILACIGLSFLNGSGSMTSYEWRRLELEIERLKLEHEFVREKMVFCSVAIDDLIHFTTVTPEPLGNSDKRAHFRSRAEKQRACVTLLCCLKKCYPSIYQYLRRKICEPVILENGFQWVEQASKKGLIGKMKNVLGKQEQHVWWASKPEINAVTRAIDRELKEEGKGLARSFKWLLCGSGESGNSTLMKQFKIHYLNGFSKAECMGYKPVIHSNTIEMMQTLINGCQDFGIVFDDPEMRIVSQRVEDLCSIETMLDGSVAKELKMLWESVEIQQCFERRSEIRLSANASYFMDNIDRFCQLDFVPNEDDILRCRARTTGIHEVEFDVNNSHFTAIDVGGSRSERRKWAHCFEDVDAIVFVVDISSFDEKLYEDENINRIQEARRLFDHIINAKDFRSCSVILLLNKSDLFKEKVKTIDMKCCFSDYKGGKDYEEASKFMRHKFTALNRRTGREVYTHVCCGIDKDEMKKIISIMTETCIAPSKKKL